MTSISDGIEWASHRFPDKPAIVGDDGSRLTYRDLDESANRLSRYLRDVRGMKPGDRVGILAGHPIRFVEAFYGVIRARCIAVPLNDRWRRVELEACLANCLPALILADETEARHSPKDLLIAHVSCHSEERSDESALGGFASCVAQNDRMKRPCYLPAGDGQTVEFGIPVAEIGACMAASDARPLADRPAGGDFFYIGYTSGSTGSPKGVLRRHSSWLDSYLAATVEFGSSQEDRILAPGALFYSLSLFAVTHTLFLGGTAFVMSEFEPRKLLELVERERVTTICMVPSLYDAVLRVKGAASRNLGSVRSLISAGAGWLRAAESKRRVLALFPSAGLYEYYGAAEMSFVSVNPPEEQMKRPRSAGRSFLGVRIQIRGNDGRPVGPGEVGVLYAQSSFGFEGYYGDPARTATVRQDGWMTVGDLAYRDEEGFLYVVGRKDNLVVTAGMNVNVEDVEEVLNGHPGVALAAVFGVEDPRRGQALVGLVQRQEGADVSLAELRTYCAARLESHKRPRRLRFVDAVPLTVSGKVSRSELSQLYAGLPSAPGHPALRPGQHLAGSASARPGR